jgi:hypothetical protein
MKNLIIIAFLFLSLSVSAQQVYNLDKKKDTTSSAVKTSDVAIYHGEKLPVYRSKNNKLFIYVVSKSGNKYKKYLNS